MDRIEVVRGPSSSLYGSSALAGVINLITEKPLKPLDVDLSVRYGSHNTYDISGEVTSSFLNKKMGIRIFADNYRTEGFSLTPTAIEQTVPPNNNWTLNGELFYDVTKNVKTRINARHFSERAENKYTIHRNNDTTLINTNVDNRESNFGFSVNHHLSNHYNLDIRFYGSDFLTKTIDVVTKNGNLYENYQFRHKLVKGEVKSTSILGAHQLTGGFGVQFEQVQSEDIDGSKKIPNYTTDICRTIGECPMF
jgi:outer membrane receptor for ferrienterochelin and colicins